MNNEASQKDRRSFMADAARVSAIVGAATFGGFLAGRKSHAAEVRWQIDPDKCVGCGKCASECVLDESAVKCIQMFDMCGFCDLCTGYFDPHYEQPLNTAAENHLCPTNAVIRTFIETQAGNKYYEYTIDVEQCIGCAKCVKGCALMNGSLYLQVMHDRCVNCNECAIAVACPSHAFVNVSAEKPYRLKKQAEHIIRRKAIEKDDKEAKELIDRVETFS